MGFNNKNNIKKGLNICEYNNVKWNTLTTWNNGDR